MAEKRVTATAKRFRPPAQGCRCGYPGIGRKNDHSTAPRLRQFSLDCPPIITGGMEDHIHLLALTYYDLGVAQSKLAQAGSASSDSLEDWRQARSWYQKSLDVLQDLKTHATLRGADASKPEELSKEIARCDAHVR